MTTTNDPVSPERVAEAVERLQDALGRQEVFVGLGIFMSNCADVRTLLSTIDHLRGEVEAIEASIQHAHLLRLKAERDASEARCAALVEALEPFAEAGKRLATREEFSLSAEQFIRADQALKAVTPTTSDGDIGEASQSLRSVPQRAVPEADYQASEVDQ